MEATVTVKGQVVIPAQIRRRLGVKQGTRLRVEEHDGAIIMRPIARDYFERMSGILDGASAVAVLEKSRREELRKETPDRARRRPR